MFYAGMRRKLYSIRSIHARVYIALFVRMGIGMTRLSGKNRIAKKRLQGIY